MLSLPAHVRFVRNFARAMMVTLSLNLVSRLSAEGAGAPAPPDRVSQEAERYIEQHVEGWIIHLDARLSPAGEHAELGAQVLSLLQAKLIEIRRVLPAPALQYLVSVPIWIEWDNTPAGRGCCYHPSREWLQAHGFNPDKARSIEICIARNFIGWANDQPAAMLHELAHAWHHQVLGFEETRVKTLWDAAVERKQYEDVLHIGGKRKRHYALTNHKEYFAEMSEAYFWTNDFYPFVQAELREADPAMFELLKELWEIKPP